MTATSAAEPAGTGLRDPRARLVLTSGTLLFVELEIEAAAG